jgi:hypothetical protein
MRPPVKGGRRLFVERRPFVQGREISFIQGRRPWKFIERRPFVKDAVHQEDAVRRAKGEIVRPRKEPFCLNLGGDRPSREGGGCSLRGGHSLSGGRSSRVGGDRSSGEEGHSTTQEETARRGREEPTHRERPFVREGGGRPLLASRLQLGARTHSFESRSPVLEKVEDGWEDGAARGGRVGGGGGKVSGVVALGTTPSPKL